MNEKKKKEKNKNMINAGEKSAENVRMKKIIKKKFSKEKENSDTMMFEIVNVKNSNARIFMKHHIDDTTSISSSFTKLFFEIKKFFKRRERDADDSAEKRAKDKKKFKEKQER